MNTIKLEAKIHGVTQRERVLRQALNRLPDSNPEYISGFAEAVSAIERLAAAEQLKLESEKALSAAMKTIRAFVSKQWQRSEISDEVKSILMVW